MRLLKGGYNNRVAANAGRRNVTGANSSASITVLGLRFTYISDKNETLSNPDHMTGGMAGKRQGTNQKIEDLYSYISTWIPKGPTSELFLSQVSVPTQ
jgi:hypothetical protein